MNRKEFLQTCALACITIPTLGVVTQGCGTSANVSGKIEGSDIVVPLSDFVIPDGEKKQYKKYIVVHNETLRHPICVYRLGDNDYSALLMQCSHKGAELQAGEQRLTCPVHGSEFDTRGVVQNKPASTNLRVFPTRIEDTYLKISLK